MTGRRSRSRLALPALAAQLALVAVLAACGGPEPTPAPAATPTPTRNPHHDELDQAQAVWETRGPSTVAYTVTETRDGATTRVHVAHMDGRSEAIVVEAGPSADDAASLTVDSLFDRAHASLDAGDRLEYTVDQLTGALPRLAGTPASGGSAWTITIDELVTPADRTSAARARDALEQVLQAWSAVDSPSWAYTWTRFTAADTAATATAYRVVHEDGATVVSAADGSSGTAAPPDAATIEGTVAMAVSVLAGGGWVNVGTDASGLGFLIAVDPSPSIKGDGFWIRVKYTDLYATRAREALDAAKSRWAALDATRYSYAWRYEGRDAAWGWNVSFKGDAAKLKPTSGAPAVEQAFVSPRVEDLLELIGDILGRGGYVVAAYDRELGYPTRVEVRSGGGLAPAGVITITRFRAR